MCVGVWVRWCRVRGVFGRTSLNLVPNTKVSGNLLKVPLVLGVCTVPHHAHAGSQALHLCQRAQVLATQHLVTQAPIVRLTLCVCKRPSSLCVCVCMCEGLELRAISSTTAYRLRRPGKVGVRVHFDARKVAVVGALVHKRALDAHVVVTRHLRKWTSKKRRQQITHAYHRTTVVERKEKKEKGKCPKPNVPVSTMD